MEKLGKYLGIAIAIIVIVAILNWMDGCTIFRTEPDGVDLYGNEDDGKITLLSLSIAVGVIYFLYKQNKK